MPSQENIRRTPEIALSFRDGGRGAGRGHGPPPISFKKNKNSKIKKKISKK
jgi:hypothetical protein